MKLKTFILSIITLSLNMLVYSQSMTSNPYSYFGLGLIENSGFCENSAVGSAGIAMPSSRSLNSTNPASYCALDSSSFLFYVGLSGKFSHFESQGIKQSVFESNIKYVAIGFKITRKWGSSVGLVPFSSRGYLVSANHPAEGDLSEYRIESSGSGSLNKFYVANSYRITKNISLGANVSYLFGLLQNDETLNYNDASFNSINLSTTNYFKNFFFDFGMQYKFKLGKNNYYTGLTFSPLQNLNTSLEKLLINGTDTINYEENVKGDFTIPASIGIGLGATCFDNQLKLMLDYKYMQWSKSSYHYNSAKLSDSWQINTGAEFNRDNKNSRNYLDYVNYRVGFRYEKSYLIIKNQRLDEIAFTAGLGFPSKYDRVIINLSYEYAIMGTKTNGLIQERYSRIILGFALSDKWFQRQKFY